MPYDLRGRPAIKAAAQIRDRLGPARRATHTIEVPRDAWEQLLKMAHRYRQALAKQWFHSAQRLQVDLAASARRLARESEQLAASMPSRPGNVPLATAGEIAADIRALAHEFTDVTIDLADRTLAVVTPSIMLAGIALGPFRIVLRWNAICGGALQQDLPFAIEAVEPHPAQSDDGIIHPHVRQGTLCAGEGQQAITRALQSGRIFDFFLLIMRVLDTYNEASAYVPLDRWSGVACQDCGHLMPGDEHGCCERCEDPLCGDCSSTCARCSYDVCSRCLDRCSRCGERFCQRCLTRENHSGLRHCTECRALILAADGPPAPTLPPSLQHEDAHDATSLPTTAAGAAP